VVLSVGRVMGHEGEGVGQPIGSILGDPFVGG
jgi:hypothetical protein